MLPAAVYTATTNPDYSTTSYRVYLLLMTPEEKIKAEQYKEVTNGAVISLLIAAIVGGLACLFGCPPAKGETIIVSAEWCGPCQRMKPTVYELQRAGHDVRVLRTDWEPDAVRTYGVRALPTTIVFRDGKEVTRHVGYLGYRQLEQLCRLGVSTRQGHWEVRPRPIASVCLFGAGVSVGCYQWVWIPGDREGVH